MQWVIAVAAVISAVVVLVIRRRQALPALIPPARPPARPRSPEAILARSRRATHRLAAMLDVAQPDHRSVEPTGGEATGAAGTQHRLATVGDDTAPVSARSDSSPQLRRILPRNRAYKA